MSAVTIGRDNASMSGVPYRNTHSKRRGFGIYLGHLRDINGEIQGELAAKLDCSTALVGSFENGTRLPTEPTLARLVKVFPDQEQEIRDEVKRWRRNSLSPEELTWASAQQNILVSLEADDEQGLRVAIDNALRDPHVRDSHRELWVHERWCEYCRTTGNLSELFVALEKAEFVASGLGVSEPSLSLLRDQLICKLIETCRTDEAQKLLDDYLSHAPNAPLLWYRKGAVEWAQGNLAGALSALNGALKSKSVLSKDIRCLRGIVHTEMEQYADALKDLDPVLENPAKLPTEYACACGARLWVTYRLGISSYENTIIAITQLEQTMPENAWLYYYRGRCHIHADDLCAGRGDWNHALIHTKPGVCKWVEDKLKETLPLLQHFAAHPLRRYP